jgi:hypothetical protein
LLGLPTVKILAKSVTLIGQRAMPPMDIAKKLVFDQRWFIFLTGQNGLVFWVIELDELYHW